MHPVTKASWVSNHPVVVHIHREDPGSGGDWFLGEPFKRRENQQMMGVTFLEFTWFYRILVVFYGLEGLIEKYDLHLGESVGSILLFMLPSLFRIVFMVSLFYGKNRNIARFGPQNAHNFMPWRAKKSVQKHKVVSQFTVAQLAYNCAYGLMVIVTY